MEERRPRTGKEVNGLMLHLFFDALRFQAVESVLLKLQGSIES